MPISAHRWLPFAVLAVALCPLRGDLRHAAPVLSPRLAHLPRITVWAWERREDLRALDPATTAIAYLDRTVNMTTAGVSTTPRRQPMLLPASTALRRIPVVRIETANGALLDEATAIVAKDQILDAVRNARNPAALQIDFDARVSERAWYRSVLEQVRAALPASLPLSITALASWCSYDGGWLRGLPIDEAVPMLFRIEPDRRVFAPNDSRRQASEYTLREPACLGTVGISTRESWPRDLADRRIYIFSDRGWQNDGLAETVAELERSATRESY